MYSTQLRYYHVTLIIVGQVDLLSFLVNQASDEERTARDLARRMLATTLVGISNSAMVRSSTGGRELSH